MRYLAFAVLSILIPFTGRAAPAQTPGANREIRMTAKKYAFSPSVITVKKGDRVELIITALDREHGFSLPAFKVNQTLKKGVPTVVSFVANKSGTFKFKCSVFCGLGHRRMHGTLIVEN